MLCGGEAFVLSYGSRRHAAKAHTCQTAMDCTAKWLRVRVKGMPPIVAEGRVPNRGVAFQLLERRTTTGRHPGNDSSFQTTSFGCKNAPPGSDAQAGRRVFSPWLDWGRHSRSASSRSGGCADFLPRTLVRRVQVASVFSRIRDVRRAGAIRGAPSWGGQVAGLFARE